MWDLGFRRQAFSGLVVSLSILILGTAVGWSSPVLIKIQQNEEPFAMTLRQQAWTVALTNAGAILSPIPLGFFMDHFGRARILMAFSILPIASWALIFVATQPYLLYVARLFLGIWNGVALTIVPIYNAEISDPKIRGAIGSVLPLLAFSGMLFEYSLGPLVSFKNLALVNGTIPICFLIMMIFVPESPHWLLMRGKKRKAELAYGWLKGYKDETLTLLEVEQLELEIKKELKGRGGMRELFLRPNNRRALSIILALSFFQKFSGIMCQEVYLPVTLPKEGVWFLSLDNFVIFLGCEWIGSIICSMFLIDRLGRKPLLMISSAGCFVSMGGMGLWFLVERISPEFTSNFRWFPFSMCVIFGFFYCIGLSPVPPNVVGELLPTSVKASGCSVNTTFGAVVTFAVNHPYLIVADVYGKHWNFFFFAVSSVVSLIFVKYFMIETRRKTLFEIHKSFNKNTTDSIQTDS